MAGEMTDRELKLVKALYECNLDTRLAAKRTRFSHQKFCSYMEKVRRESGLNPREFHDIIVLIGGKLPGKREWFASSHN